ncbi:MAG: hypothetical protein ABFS56_30415 [Pseudomonadota bacterium]
MSSNEIINIIGIGARTTIGATAPLTALAVRAGINCFAEHPYRYLKSNGADDGA